MLCTLCSALLTDAEIEKCQEESIIPFLCIDCLDEMEEDEKESLTTHDTKHLSQIDTPDNTIAKYLYTDHAGNPIYYDGIDYWVVDKQGNIDYYG